MTGGLFHGDNYDILQKQWIEPASIDLIYLDPPFNSNATYNVLFRSPAGSKSHAQAEAFTDTWRWSEQAELAFDEVMRSQHSGAAIVLRAVRSALGESDVMAYLAMMAVRLIRLREVLKPTGSLYLHCDPTASHYLKVLMDGIFGGENFRSEIAWKRTSAHNSAKRWGPVHDVILFYSASPAYTWNQVHQKYDEEYVRKFYRHKDERGRLFRVSDLTGAGIRQGESGSAWQGVNPTAKGRHWAPPRKFPGGEQVPKPVLAALDYLDAAGLIHWPEKGGVPGFKRYLGDMHGVQVQDVIDDIPPLSPNDKEQLGYPTQKPLALLERIIAASSNPGDTVLDAFCGCGTAVHAAEKLGRAWIGVDISSIAVSLIEKRIFDAFGFKPPIRGWPKDFDSAALLAKRDKHDFQNWFVIQIGGQLYQGGKKGMDRGVDGYLHFRDAERKPQMAIVSVKGGHVDPGMIRDLKATVERENGKFGLFLSLHEPTREMTREANASGIYETGGMRFPKLQILSVADLFAGKRPQVPFGHTEGLAVAEKESRGKQGSLL